MVIAPTFLSAATIAPLQMPPANAAQLGVLSCDPSDSVARSWNEQLLAAIRVDAARPTVHARNLFHTSLAMYEAFAAFDPVALPYLHDESAAALGQSAAAMQTAISYAAYRVLLNRFSSSPGAATTLPQLDNCMQSLGLDNTQTTVSGNSPVAIGNRIAAAIINYGLQDNSNQQNGYIDTSNFIPSNNPLSVELPGTGGVLDVNAWQPLIPPGATSAQSFLTPHWRAVTPFALQRSAPNTPYLDPGLPPKLGGIGDAQVKQDVLDLIRFSGRLDPSDAVSINISPRLVGNNSLGTSDGNGYVNNPVTGAPYPDNFTLRGDWGRVLSEFWADGPRSSTPPGHWNEIANEVSDHPATIKRIGGAGPILSDLEWDIKLYLALNGALHDNAIATWEVKRLHNVSRPITLIREMGSLGQSSNSAMPSYHPQGLPLEPGVVELISAQSSAPGERHAHLAAHIGSIAIYAWLGHPAVPATEFGGAGWILATHWIPYQQRNFVTPPFPGYTSGHSGFSRAAAEVLTAFTGSAFFPGGLGEFVANNGGAPNFGLSFEFGPSQPVRLQWASYFDAADEAGLSRIHGGIHPAFDDYPGRVIGHRVGLAAMQRARALFSAPLNLQPVPALDSRLVLLLGLMILLLGSAVLRSRS